MFLYLSTCLHVYMYIYIFECKYVFMYVNLEICKYVYMYMCIYIYINKCWGTPCLGQTDNFLQLRGLGTALGSENGDGLGYPELPISNEQDDEYPLEVGTPYIQVL